MPLPITTAAQSMQEPERITGVILGPHGIGKTSLLWSLDPATTLFINMEGGEKSVRGWPGDMIKVREAALAMKLPTWEFMRALAAWLGGPDPAATGVQPYTAEHFAYACKLFGDRGAMKHRTLFYDSISHLSFVCHTWAKTQPRAFTKEGKVDGWGIINEYNDAMKGMLKQLQATPDMNVWLVGGLDRKVDQYKRSFWKPQLDSADIINSLPGIVDQVISMVEHDFGPEQGGKMRAFICQTLNPGDYPAKDRSRQLDMVEEPHLGKLMAKIEAKNRQNAALVYGAPPSRLQEDDPLQAQADATRAFVTGEAA